MQDKNLKSFHLVGGTALALYIGHRKSIDPDLFSRQSFDTNTFEILMNDTYGFEILNPNKRSDATLIGNIN